MILHDLKFREVPELMNLQKMKITYQNGGNYYGSFYQIMFSFFCSQG